MRPYAHSASFISEYGISLATLADWRDSGVGFSVGLIISCPINLHTNIPYSLSWLTVVPLVVVHLKGLVQLLS